MRNKIRTSVFKLRAACLMAVAVMVGATAQAEEVTVKAYVNGSSEATTLKGEVKDGPNGTQYIVTTDASANKRAYLIDKIDDSNVADVNGDNAVTIADVTALVNIILGKTGTLSDVELEYDVTVPYNDQYTKLYIPLDDVLMDGFQMSAEEIGDHTRWDFTPTGPASDQVMFFAYSSDGATMQNAGYNGDGKDVGYWLDAEGNTGNGYWQYAVLQVCFDKDVTRKFFIRQHPDNTKVGETYQVKVGLQYNKDGKIYTAKVTMNVTIAAADATGSYDVTGRRTGQQVGDVNGDGSVTIADVTALVNIILGKTAYEAEPLYYLTSLPIVGFGENGDIIIGWGGNADDDPGKFDPSAKPGRLW